MNGFPSGFCPYKGLQPYTEEDRAYFFGRERDQEIIASNLYAAPLTVLYGASGVGKSSVLLAGVVPKLRQTPRLAIVVFRDWQNPDFQSALKAELLKEVERSLGKPCGVDAALAFDDFLAACARSLRGPVFFLLDQFEEYFLYHRSGEGDDSFDVAFARAVNREEIGANFMLSIREDGISKLDRFQGRIPNLLSNMLRLDYLDREAATRAIRRPLDEYNRRLPAGQAPVVIEDKLVETLLRDLQTGRVNLDQAGQGQADTGIPVDARIETPFLQLVLTRLWQEEMAAGSSVLRLETLNRLGGTENIARTHLDTAMEELSETERDVAARMFRFLVTPSGSKIAQDLPSLVSWSEVDEATATSVLALLTSGTRIVRSVSAAGQADRYEIFHDVLAPAILDWRRRYVQAQDLREAEKQAAEQRKRADEQARAATRLRLLAGALAVVTLLVLAVAVFAFRAQRTAVAAEKKAVAAQHEANEKRNEAVRAEGRATSASAKAEREKRRAEHQARLAAQRAEEALTAKTEADLAKATAEEQRANAEKQERIATSRELAAAADRNRNELGILLAMEAVKATYAFDGTVTNEARDILAQAAEGAKLKLSLPGHLGEIVGVAYSPDGRRIATHSRDNTMKIWDADSGQLVKTLEWPGSYRTQGIGFSADGKRIAAGDGLDIVVRDVSTGAQKLSGHGARGSIIEKFALSPDGESLATVSSDENVRLWRSPDGTEPLVFEDETAIQETQRAEVAFSSNGARLIIVRPKRVTVIDASSGAVLRTFPFQAPNDGVAALSADGNRFAITLGGGIRIWDVAIGSSEPQKVWENAGRGPHLSFSSDGSRLLSGSETGFVVWEVGSGAMLLERSRDRFGPMAISPKGDRLAFSSGDTSFRVINVVADDDFVVESWGAQETKMWGVAFSADGRRVAATSDKGVLRVWEVVSGKEITAAVAPFTTALALSPDGKSMAAVKENEGTVALYDSASGKLLRSLPVQQSTLFRAAFSPDGSKLVTVGYDHGPKFFDVASGKDLFRLQEPNGAFNLAFSKDGRRLATGGRTSAIWDIDSKSKIHPLEILGNEVAFSPDGRLLAISSDQATAVFNVSSGQRLYEVSGGVKRDLWHQGAIGLAFSPNGRLLATVQENLTVKVWDAENGTEQMTLYGHGGTVRGISFSTDGSKLIAVSEDWTTHAHPLRIEDLMTLARSRVERELTVEERKKYLHQP
jgi:WD40 repeat protein